MIEWKTEMLMCGWPESQSRKVIQEEGEGEASRLKKAEKTREIRSEMW